MQQQPLTLGCQGQLQVIATEQFFLQKLLGALDLLADGALCQVQKPPRSGHAAGLGGGYKGPRQCDVDIAERNGQIIKFHNGWYNTNLIP